MKKIFLLSIFLLSILFFNTPKSNAVTLEEALSQSKPVALLLYADWADGAQSMLSLFNQMEQQYGNSYNFVKINIANKEAKLFNQKFYIYPNLPYIMLFRDRGRISRFLQKDCASNSSCFKEKLDLFNL